jgi:hypothetical protein
MPLSEIQIARRQARAAAVRAARAARALIAIAKAPAPYVRELRRQIKANELTRENLLGELGRPSMSPIVKTLIKLKIREGEAERAWNVDVLAMQDIPEARRRQKEDEPSC